MSNSILNLSENIRDEKIIKISSKVFNNKRITPDDALSLFENAELSVLGVLADFANKQKNGNYVYFNRNFHIEPTNICIYNCRFCSYAVKINKPGSWEFSVEEIIDAVKKQVVEKGITEVHIVGGVHPHRDLYHYGNILTKIKEISPNLHIKAFTAVELDYMIRKAELSLEEGLLKLKEFGLDSIPGGGAEIFNDEIRKQVCDEKSSSEMWLKIHETAHKSGLQSNATMLYGHIEKFEHRVDHLLKLRELQDRTNGFNTFIPLKYRKANNELFEIGETSVIDDLKTFSVSRIFLDNFPHLKAYWPGIGKKTAQISLSFGVDDIDGTIDDSTKIYSMAGAEDLNPKMTEKEIVNFIKQTGKTAVERDTLYNVIKLHE